LINEFSVCHTGAIRVYCRVRPFLPGQSNGQSTVDYIGENGDMMIVNPIKQGKDARRVFSFNKVFGTSVTQGILIFNTLLQKVYRIGTTCTMVCMYLTIYMPIEDLSIETLVVRG